MQGIGIVWLHLVSSHIECRIGDEAMSDVKMWRQGVWAWVFSWYRASRMGESIPSVQMQGGGTPYGRMDIFVLLF